VYDKLTTNQVYSSSIPAITAQPDSSNREGGGSPSSPNNVLNPTNFDIFYQNFRRLRTKRSRFNDNAHASNHKIHCPTETWPNDTILSHSPFPASYSVFRADRGYLNSHTTRRDGVLLAVSNLLQNVMRRQDLEGTKEYVWIEIPVSGNLHLLTGNHYLPPDFNVTIIDNKLNFLEQHLNAHQYRSIMLGDFNARNNDWVNGAPLPNSYYYNKI
jgi:hypothetical protein